MKRIKEVLVNIQKRIKKANIVYLLKSKTIIKELENKIGDLGKEKQDLIDKLRNLNSEKEKYELEANKVPNLIEKVKKNNKSIKQKTEQNKELEKIKLDLEIKLFESNQELARVKIQLEEYEAQIKDLKSDRYLIRKVRAGRTPNTNKTKISKPMSAKVTNYMRNEHE